jgi:hypothetical protein
MIINPIANAINPWRELDNLMSNNKRSSKGKLINRIAI